MVRLQERCRLAMGQRDADNRGGNVDLHQRGRTKRELVEVAALSLPVSLVLAAAVPVAGIATGAASGAAKVWLGLVTAILAAVSGYVAWLRGSKTGGYKRAAARYARLVAGAGQPVVVALGELCASTPTGPDDARLVTLRDRVIDTARVQCGTTSAENTRAAIYEFRGTRDLHRAAYNGRRRPPRTEFREGDVANGRDVVEFAASTDGRVDRVSDVREGAPAPRGVVDRNADYRSYMSAPVSVAEKSWGMLTVDSPDVGAFRGMDEDTIAMLAGALAAGLAHANVSPQAPSRVTVTE